MCIWPLECVGLVYDKRRWLFSNIQPAVLVSSVFFGVIVLGSSLMMPYAFTAVL